MTYETIAQLRGQLRSLWRFSMFWFGLSMAAVIALTAINFAYRWKIDSLQHVRDVARDYVEGRATRDDLQHAVLATTPAEVRDANH